jgi:hypothetical protein
MTSNLKPQTSNSSSGAKVVRLRKPHPCGSNEFTIIRESVVVTLRCNTCESVVRMPKEKYEKAVARSQEPGVRRDNRKSESR